MQSKKIIVACLSLLLLGLALPAVNIANIPKANAFHQSSSVTIAGLALAGYSDSVTTGGATRDIATAGSTVTFNVAIFATQTVYQRNVTVGIKFDWMTAYQNATNASPTNTLALTANQQSSVSISIGIPSASATINHDWTLLLGMGPQNKVIGPGCSTSDQDTSTSVVCLTSTRPGHPYQVQIWSSDQSSAAQAKFQASTTIAQVGPYVTAASGTSAGNTAAGQLAQAKTEITLGDTSWGTGDYSGAKTHYQNAANNANAAAASLTNLGGGSSNAGIVSTILGGTGTLLFGLGGLLAGLGGFFYLRRKPKA